MDCPSSVISRLHEEKFSCGRTKCESIVTNVLAAFTMQQIFEELESVTYRMNLFVLQIQVKPEWMNAIQNHLQILKGGLKYSSLCEVNVFR
jgi:hypothetical protein